MNFEQVNAGWDIMIFFIYVDAFGVQLQQIR